MVSPAMKKATRAAVLRVFEEQYTTWEQLCEQVGRLERDLAMRNMQLARQKKDIEEKYGISLESLGVKRPRKPVAAPPPTVKPKISPGKKLRAEEFRKAVTLAIATYPGKGFTVQDLREHLIQKAGLSAAQADTKRLTMLCDLNNSQAACADCAKLPAEWCSPGSDRSAVPREKSSRTSRALTYRDF